MPSPSATSSASAAPVWRVCVTRDEAADGPLGSGLRARAFVPVPCAVLVEAPPEDAPALTQTAGQLERHDWIGATTAAALAHLDVPCVTAAVADFAAATDRLPAARSGVRR